MTDELHRSKPTFHVVTRGECLSTIAARYGFRDYKVIYDHPDNAAFKKKRPDPNIIQPGDELVIPPHQAKTIECAAQRCHRFVVKSGRKRLHLRFCDEHGEPLAGAPYRLAYDDVVVEDATNSNGEIERQVPLDTRTATVDIGGRRYRLSIGGLDPLHDTDDDGTSGMRQRLTNLGIGVGHDATRSDEASCHAIALFQLQNDLRVTGHLDEPTRKKLEDRHGC